MSLVDRLKAGQNGAAPQGFGPPQMMGPPQGQGFGPPMGQAPMGQAPQGAPQQGFGPPPQVQQMQPQLQQQIASLEEQERQLRGGQPPAYVQQPATATSFAPQPTAAYPPAQQMQQPWAQPQAPQQAQQPQAPQMQQQPWAQQAPAPQQGFTPQPVPYGQCMSCGEMLTNQNGSRLQDGSVRHIACPRQPPQILPPDAPQSQPHLAANPIAPEALAGMSPQVQQAARNFDQQFGASAAAAQGQQYYSPQLSPAANGHVNQVAAQQQPIPQGGQFPGQFIAPPKGEKCRASRVQMQITQEQAMRRALLCPGGCGQTIQIKPEQIAGTWVAKIKNHHLDVPPSGAPAQGAVDRSAASVTPLAAAPATDGLALYLDVSLQGVVATDLEQYVANCVNSLAQQYQAADIRCAPADSPLAYGRWKGALAAVVRQYPPNGVCILNGSAQSELKQVVVETLTPMCKAIVRGQK